MLPFPISHRHPQNGQKLKAYTLTAHIRDSGSLSWDFWTTDHVLGRLYNAILK